MIPTTCLEGNALKCCIFGGGTLGKLSLPAGGVAALARHRLPRTCSGVLRVRVKVVLKGKFGKSNDLVKRSKLSLKYFSILKTV